MRYVCRYSYMKVTQRDSSYNVVVKENALQVGNNFSFARCCNIIFEIEVEAAIMKLYDGMGSPILIMIIAYSKKF